MGKVYTKIGDFLLKNLMWIIGLGAIVCLGVANLAVIARVTKTSISWTDEVVRLIFVYIIFIGSALSYRLDGLIGITMLEETLIGKARNIPYKIIKILQHVVCTGFAIFCTYQCYLLMASQIKNNETSAALEIATAWTSLGCILGMILWSYYGFGKIVEYIKKTDIKKAE